MKQIRLSEELYSQVSQRATEAGFASVDEYVADLLHDEFTSSLEKLDARFTPEVIAYLEGIAAEMEAGSELSLEDVRTNLERLSDSLRENAS